ncbi:PrgH/EprH family type III secretion apparatus protein [Citrobacter sp. wls826]|uniref:PrgH/EprH family type III secretion apparatus protein n=1 Tax=Citrobacter sp. wls826 TaxID=2576415 RepID=UPI0010C94467|nr:hypothetical protein FDW87_08485 [Citrobacter sp. wls826]TKV30112.1 hypothetical protein FDX20_27225 [Citrobacter sp. TBCS-11]
MEKVKDEDKVAKLRILNTPMNGCEFPLYEDSNLFVTKNYSLDEDGYHQTELILPEEVVFLPSVGIDFNFEVVVSEQDTDHEFTIFIRELREEKCNEYQVELNVPFSVDGLKLVVAKKKRHGLNRH